jgi:FMN phosphatase YigB (HAD superfamily)
MRAILFDLGDTLVDAQNRPLPGATDLLTALRDLRDPEGKGRVPIFPVNR